MALDGAAAGRALHGRRGRPGGLRGLLAAGAGGRSLAALQARHGRRPGGRHGRAGLCGQGEGAHQGPRRAGRRPPPDAHGRRREGLPLRSRRRGRPARPLRRAAGNSSSTATSSSPASATGRTRAARGARSSPTTCPTSRTSTPATRRSSSPHPAGQDEIAAAQAADGLARAVVHDGRRRLRRGLRRVGVLRASTCSSATTTDRVYRTYFVTARGAGAVHADLGDPRGRGRPQTLLERLELAARSPAGSASPNFARCSRTCGSSSRSASRSTVQQRLEVARGRGRGRCGRARPAVGTQPIGVSSRLGLAVAAAEDPLRARGCSRRSPGHRNLPSSSLRNQLT